MWVGKSGVRDWDYFSIPEARLGRLNRMRRVADRLKIHSCHGIIRPALY